MFLRACEAVLGFSYDLGEVPSPAVVGSANSFRTVNMSNKSKQRELYSAPESYSKLQIFTLCFVTSCPYITSSAEWGGGPFVKI